MAGVLNLTAAPIFSPCSRRRTSNHRLFSVKSSANTSESPLSTRTEAGPGSGISVSAPPDFRAPEPKPFWVRPDKFLDILGASLALLFRLTTSVLVTGYSVTVVPSKEIPSDQYALGFAGFKLKETSKVGPRPEMPIEIYEFESCPFCRKVDPNTGVSMYESDDIIKYLVGKYGDGKVPFLLSLGLFTTLTEGFAMIGRMGKGSSYTPSKLPPKPLEIWAYEASPFCKVVREALVELELPHIFHSCARGSLKRQILYQRVGHFQVPYLEDPNTGIQMFESADIIQYLRATYAV